MRRPIRLNSFVSCRASNVAIAWLVRIARIQSASGLRDVLELSDRHKDAKLLKSHVNLASTKVRPFFPLLH